jgi:hypothetical protein
MKKKIFYNIISPLLLGVFIYYLNFYIFFFDFISNYIPDGLWAYAFTSTILIIWNKRINYLWIIILFIFYFLFEFLQSIHFLKGTGDIIDIIIYFIFSFISIYVNSFSQKQN